MSTAAAYANAPERSVRTLACAVIKQALSDALDPDDAARACGAMPSSSSPATRGSGGGPSAAGMCPSHA